MRVTSKQRFCDEVEPCQSVIRSTGISFIDEMVHLQKDIQHSEDIRVPIG